MNWYVDVIIITKKWIRTIMYPCISLGVLCGSVAATECIIGSGDGQPSLVGKWENSNLPGLDIWANGVAYFLIEEIKRRNGEISRVGERALCFDAVRMDLKLYEMNLVDVPSIVDTQTFSGQRGIDEKGRKAEVLRYSLGNLFEITSKEFGVIAVTNAGWFAGYNPPKPLGYTKIDGEIGNSYSKYHTAIICLDDITKRKERDDGQVPVMFSYSSKLNNDNNPGKWGEQKKLRIEKCANSFQTGPRIIEYERDEAIKPGLAECLEREKSGICNRSLLLERRRWSIMAIDKLVDSDENRPDRVYLLTTQNEVSLFDLQELLFDKRFVDGFIHWAVNLLGGDDSGLIVNGGSKLVFGNSNGTLATGLVFTRIGNGGEN